MALDLDGGCYCGALRYKVTGDALFKGQCHCRECQYISGGSPNVCLAIPHAGFEYTKGEPKQFKRSDLETPVTRDFCAECGTHICARPPSIPGVVLKVGTLDDPAEYGTPQMAIYLCDKQPFHQVPDGVATFDKVPG